MQQSNSNATYLWPLLLILIVWSSWVILEYLTYHDYAINALALVPYGKLLLLLGALLGGGLGYLYFQQRKQKKPTYQLPIRGIYLFIGLQVFAAAIIIAYVGQTPMPNRPISSRIGQFFAYSTVLLLALLLLHTAAFAIGKLCLRPIESSYRKNPQILQLATGWSILGFLLVLLGLVKGLVPIILGVVLVGILIAQFQAVKTFLVQLIWQKRILAHQQLWPFAIYAALLAATAINWIGSIKSFAAGFDGAGLYMNTTKLIADYGGLPAGGQGYNWSVVMSLGHILFQNTSIAILLSHSLSLLCLFLIYRIARLWLTPAYAILAAAIPYLSPYFGFHAFVDEKVDLGFLFIALASFLAVVEPWIKQSRAKKTPTPIPDWSIGNLRFSAVDRQWLLAGWICGYAFGIKYTALFLLIALGSIAFYRAGKGKAYFGWLLISIGAIFCLQIHRFGYLDLSTGGALGLGGGLIAAGLGIWAYSFRENWMALKPAFTQCILLGVCFTLAYLPWAGKHLMEHQQISVQNIIQGKFETPEIAIPPKYLSQWQEDLGAPKVLLTSDQEQGQSRAERKAKRKAEREKAKEENNNAISAKSTASKQQSVREEIQRYLGYESGIWRYTSLPYDLTTGFNIPGFRHTDVGFLFLLLFPLLLISGQGGKWALAKNIGLGIALILWVISCYWAMHMDANGQLQISDLLSKRLEASSASKTTLGVILWNIYGLLLSVVLSLASALQGLHSLGAGWPFIGQFVGMAGIVGLLIFWGQYRLAQFPVSIKQLVAFLVSYGVLWWFIGNGIIWYAFPFWVLLPIPMVYFLQKPEKWLGEAYRPLTQRFLGAIFGLQLFMFTSLYFTNPQYAGPPASLYSWPFVEYASNLKTTYQDNLQHFNPAFPPAVKALNSDLSQKIYKINSYLGYHIQHNDRRVYSDNTLSKFDEVANVLSNEMYFIDVLKDNGFGYLLYDLGTISIDKTPEQSLRKKCERLINILLTSPRLQLVTSDNYVRAQNGQRMTLPNGQQVMARIGIDGQTVRQGTFVLFKIL